MLTSSAKGTDQPRSTLRVFIEKEDGLEIDDIVRTSRKIGAHLEVEGTLPGRYLLEVSSPGLDRLLFKPAHFLPQVGQKIQISLSYPKDNQKNFQGILQGVDGDEISLFIEKNKHHPEKVETFSFEQIDKARLMPNIQTGKTGKGKKRGVEKE